jgi:hypothetical protein
VLSEIADHTAAQQAVVSGRVSQSRHIGVGSVVSLDMTGGIAQSSRWIVNGVSSVSDLKLSAKQAVGTIVLRLTLRIV